MRETTFGCAETSKHQRGKLAIVTCFFNWAGFSRKTANLRRFLLQMQAQRIPVFGIEAVLPGQQAVTQGFAGWERVPANDRNILFQKEAMLNRVVSLVPDHYTKIAWFDADVWFENAGWYDYAEALLDNYQVVQLYDSAKWISQDGSIEIQRDSIAKWNAHGRKGAVSTSHTGFAWAARRELWTQFGGLFPHCITGSGDVFSAIAFCGIDPEQHPLLATDRQNLNADFKRWAWKVKEWTGGRVGYVPGIIYHEWHGSRRDRNYVKRHEVCSRIAKSDVRLNENGLHEWAETASPEVVAAVKGYFIERREDGDEEQAEPVQLLPAVSASIAGASIVVTTHPAYVEFLSKTLEAIDKQSRPFAQKILVLDGFDVWPFESPPEGWEVINSFAKNPNAARNAGLRVVVNDWVIFWDGDNIMPPAYHESMIAARALCAPNCAVLYPDIKYVDTAGEHKKTLVMPPYDYWNLRARAHIDTSSIWRVDAIRGVGGWSEAQPRLDDYALALKLTRAGWAAARANVFTSITSHPDRRSSNNDLVEAMWQAYSFGILTLWSGMSDAAHKLVTWYLTAELPPKSHLYWLVADDESLQRMLGGCANLLAVRGISVTVKSAGKAYVVGEGGTREFGRHLHVANLYNSILPSITEDMLMMIEDDNIGPLDGIRSLLSSFKSGEGVAAAAGLYRSRSNPACACASSSPERWITVQHKDAIGKQLPIYMSGGGFTLFGNWAIRQALPFRASYPDGRVVGWDNHLGKSIHASGQKMILRGDIQVEHLAPEVESFLVKHANL